MIELCIDARMLFSGGIGTYLKNLIPRVKDAGIKIKLLAAPLDIEKLKWEKSYEVIPSNAPIYSIKEQINFPLLIPSCDIFWSPHFNVPLFPIKAKKRLTTIHDVYHLAYYSSLRLHERAYAKVVINKAVKSSNRIITVTKFSKDEICKYTKAESEKISSIHSGVDREFFSLAKDTSHLLMAKRLFLLPEKFILFVGNVKPHKNLRGLLNAFKILSTQGFKDYQLVIVGKREGFIRGDDLNSLIGEESLFETHVKFLGFVEEKYLPAIYRLASLAIMPSFYEGFGLPALEAMSTGCPFVASFAASLPEVCGDGAEYVNPQDPKDIARGISKVLLDQDFREKLKEKGLQRVKSFSWEETAKKHIQLIEELHRK